MVPLLSGQNTAPESVLIRSSGILDALIAYYEAEWARAYPLPMAKGPAPVDDVDRQVLALLLAGLTDQAVASQLGLSLRSVQRRIAALMEVAGVTTRIQLGWHAGQHGWA
jgi:DNA-binding NarL/FixJ family response regulator